MFNLIIKDILIQKKNLLFALLYTIFGSVAFFQMGPGGFGLYVISPMAVIYILVTFAVSYDDKNKSEFILNSLPVERSDIVISKYMSTFVYAIIGVIYAILIGLIGKAIGLSMFSRSISLLNIVFVFTTSCIFSSIFFPVYFKFGNIKMKFFNIILFMIIIFSPTFYFDYVTKNPKNILIEKINYFITNTSSFTLNSLALIIGLFIFLISLMISIRIYNNKEF